MLTLEPSDYYAPSQLCTEINNLILFCVNLIWFPDDSFLRAETCSNTKRDIVIQISKEQFRAFRWFGAMNVTNNAWNEQYKIQKHWKMKAPGKYYVFVFARQWAPGTTEYNNGGRSFFGGKIKNSVQTLIVSLLYYRPSGRAEVWNIYEGHNLTRYIYLWVTPNTVM